MPSSFADAVSVCVLYTGIGFVAIGGIEKGGIDPPLFSASMDHLIGLGFRWVIVGLGTPSLPFLGVGCCGFRGSLYYVSMPRSIPLCHV